MTSPGDLVGLLIVFGPPVISIISMAGKWKVVGDTLLRLLSMMVQYKADKPAANNGNGSHHKQMYESLLMTQESESSRIGRMEKAFDEFKAEMSEKLNQQGLQTRGMFDSVLLNVNNMKRAMDERLTRQDGQIAELLTIARNGNGKHPPEADEQPGDKS